MGKIFCEKSYKKAAKNCLQKCFLQKRWVCFREKGDLGDKDKSVDLQLSPYQSMKGLGSEELKW